LRRSQNVPVPVPVSRFRNMFPQMEPLTARMLLLVRDCM